MVIVSGFLGSGKTTIIRHLLRQAQLGEVAIIVNEFGEVGLDHYLVRKTDERTVLLSSGCICCSMRSDLAETLRDLLSKREREQIPPFERVVIETTGLADPAPILHTIVSEPVVRHHFEIERVIITVDAVNGASSLASHGEALKQITAADSIVITKQDLVPEHGAIDLKERVRGINPSAAILESADGALDVADLFTAEPRLNHETGRIDRGDGTAVRTQPAGSAGPTPDDHLAARAVTSRCIIRDHPLDWPVFGMWLTMLLHQHGTRILRFKGLLNVGSTGGPLVLQGVQHVVHAPRHLKEWPDDDHRSRMVIIAHGLDPDAIERSMDLFQELAAGPSKAQTLRT